MTFKADDYIKRVLANALEQFQHDSSLPDIFERYDLPLDVEDPQLIEDRIRAVTACWNRQKANPRLRPILERLLAPQESERATRLLVGTYRIAEKCEALRIRESKDLARHNRIDKKLRFLETKGNVSMAELVELQAQLGATLFSLEEIRRRVRVPITTKAPANSIPEEAEVLPEGDRSRIRSGLRVLGLENLFEFLGVSESAATLDIYQKWKDLEESWRPKAPDYKKTAAQLLLGSVKTHLVDGDAGRYRKTLRFERIDQLRQDVRLAGISKRIVAEQFDQLTERASDLRLSESEITDVILSLASEVGAAVDLSRTPLRDSELKGTNGGYPEYARPAQPVPLDRNAADSSGHHVPEEPGPAEVEDVSDTQQIAVKEALSSYFWRHFGLTKGTLQRSLSRTSNIAQTYERALVKVHTKTITIKRTAVDRNCRLGPMPVPSDYDPWQIDGSSLSSTTMVITECEDCSGEGDVVCGACHGGGYVRCRFCLGSGVTASMQKNRMFKNCPNCRGSGQRQCNGCRRGKVACHLCRRSGRILAWLELSQNFRNEVIISPLPLNAAASSHDKLIEPSDFDNSSWLGRRLLCPTENFKSPPATGLGSMTPKLDPRTERIAEARVQKFSANVQQVIFETARGPLQIEIAGAPPVVVFPKEKWGALRTRRRLMTGAGVMGAAGSTTLGLAHFTRHPWFLQNGATSAAASVGLAAVATLCAVWVAHAVLLSPNARNRIAVVGTILGLLLCGTGAVFAFGYPRPSVLATRISFKEGRVADAREEARALVDLNLAPAEGNEILRQIRFSEAKINQSVAALATAYHEIPVAFQTERADVARYLVAVVRRKAAADFADKSIAGLQGTASEIGEVIPEVRDGLLFLSAALLTAESLDAGDLPNANKALSVLLALSPTAADLIGQPSSQTILEAATTLTPVIRITRQSNVHKRLQFLATVIPAVRVYVSSIGLDPAGYTDTFEKTLDSLKKKTARIKQKDPEIESLPESRQHDDRAPETADNNTTGDEALEPTFR